MESWSKGQGKRLNCLMLQGEDYENALLQRPCKESAPKKEWSSIVSDAERLSEKGHGDVLWICQHRAVSLSVKWAILRIIDYRESVSKTSLA